MSAINVLFYVAIIGFVIYRRVQGRPICSAKQLFILPVILTVIGFEDVAHKSLGAMDITFVVIGCAVSLLLGATRGLFNKVTIRDGQPWVRWGAASVVVLALNVIVKLILDVIDVAAGGTTSGATSSLLLSVGLMLVGEAAVVWLRLQHGVGTLPSMSTRDEHC